MRLDELRLTEADIIKDDVSVVRRVVSDFRMQLTMTDVIDYVKAPPFYVPENCLFGFSELKNRYFLIRHGRSVANEKGLIVSQPLAGVNGYGLVDAGRAEVSRSAAGFLRDLGLQKKQLVNAIGEDAADVQFGNNEFTDENTVILSSDFLRTVQTAEVFAKMMGLSKIQKVKDLRERDFGKFDMREAALYKEVWGYDEHDYALSVNGVESVASVLRRGTQLVKTVERMREGKNVFMVLHGDIGQILETGFRKMDPAKHRSLRSLQNGEIREMWLNPLMQAA